MRYEQTYHTAQAIANLLNRRIVGRSGTVYIPGSSMIVVNDDKKRVRLEETAARVRVPRDPLADAMDFAGLHKDVLFGLASDVSIDAWADVWSDAVVVSREPWDRYGALRHHAWDLSKPRLPPLLERSLRFDPHRWVVVGAFRDAGLDALLRFSPKSLDLNGGFHDVLGYMCDSEEAEGDHEAQLFLKLIAGAERIRYFNDDGAKLSDFSTPTVMKAVLPFAKNLKELFINTRSCNEGWLQRIVCDAGHPELVNATGNAMDGLKWVERASEFDNEYGDNEAQFDGDKLIVGDERYTLSECFQKAAANPYMDVRTQICIMEWQRQLLDEKEQAPLAVQIVEMLRHAHRLTFNTFPGEGRLSVWPFHGEQGTSPLWEALEEHLRETKRSVCIGGVVFDHEDCLVSFTVLEDSLAGWRAMARMLHAQGPDATITVKHDLIDDFAATPREVNCLDCMCYAVYPRDPCSASTARRTNRDDWLNFATMMKPGDRIRSLWSHRNRGVHCLSRSFSAIDCCEVFFDARKAISYNSVSSWMKSLRVILTHGDVSAAIPTPHGAADWRMCAARALSQSYKDGTANTVWREVADLIPSDGIVHLKGCDYTKGELKNLAEEVARERKA